MSANQRLLKGRQIHNNIRLILDMIDYRSFINSESLILFIDFFKAFDSIDHNFLFRSLELFGFGNKFCKVIKLFYKQIYSYVSLNPGITSRIDIFCGIRQGCPISPKLFILCTQLMAYLIVNHSDIEGINIFDIELKISQFADDTVIFLKDKSILEKALNVISIFSKASGLCLNLKKCELLPLYDCLENSMRTIPVKNEVKYLGIYLDKDINTRESKNLKDKIDGMSKTLNHWLTRDITIFGRNLLSKSEGVSKMVYPAYSLYITPKSIKKINSIIYQFIWRNKTHYIKKSQLVKDYAKGGIKSIDFQSMVGVFKINWIKAFLLKPDSIWFHIPKNIFKKVGGLDFLLKCDFDILKLPVKLSEYHKQVLSYWKMVFAHNFSPHCSTLWNNRTITINKKSLFIKEWFEKNIIFITDLLDERGQFLSVGVFNAKFNIQCSLREYDKVCKAIPLPLLSLIQGYLYYSKAQISLPSLHLNQILLTDKNCNNKTMNKIFKNKLFHDFNSNTKLKGSNVKITNKYTHFLKWPIPPKVKEMQFKIINGYYPAAEMLKKRFGFEVEPCGFCSQNAESIDHLFFSCSVTTDFWQDLVDWLSIRIDGMTPLTLTQVLYNNGDPSKELSMLHKVVIIMGKYHIHKCKWQSKRPSLTVLKIELKSFLSSLELLRDSCKEAALICDNGTQSLSF
uniref:Reverse transcriptase domain-containing protein n=1 Tax=Maylandia zebra TaxID=106582 RepID=A0A3P9AV59_9CICH